MDKASIEVFQKRVEGLRTAIPDLPKVTYCDDTEAIKELHVVDRGEVIDMRTYYEILVINGVVINVNCNSLDCNIKTIIDFYYNQRYLGYVGHLI